MYIYTLRDVAKKRPHLAKKRPHLAKKRPHLAKKRPHLAKTRPHLAKKRRNWRKSEFCWRKKIIRHRGCYADLPSLPGPGMSGPAKACCQHSPPGARPWPAQPKAHYGRPTKVRGSLPAGQKPPQHSSPGRTVRGSIEERNNRKSPLTIQNNVTIVDHAGTRSLQPV